MRYLFWSGIATLALLSYGCSSTPSPAPEPPSLTPPVNADTTITNSPNSSNAEKLEIKITVLPDNVSEERTARIELLQTYLREILEQPVTVIESTSYEDTVAKIVDGTVNVAYLGPLTYIKAKAQNETIEPLVAPIDESSGRPWYTSVVVGKKNIQSLEGLRGKKFSFVSDSSTSGFLVPNNEMQTLGIDPERDFASLDYSGAHDKNLDLLIEEQVDAIAVDHATYQEGVDSGKLDTDKFHVVWESDPIPNSPITASGDIPEDMKLALQRAFIDAPEGLVSVGVTEAKGYTIVEDKDYDLIRELYQNKL